MLFSKMNCEKMNRFVWTIIIAGMLHSCGPHTGYTIHGELADTNGLKVVLRKITADADEPVTLDSCVIKKGKFKMKGTLEYPEYCELYVGDHGPLLLILGNTELHIDIDLKNIQNSKVTGSNETDLLVAYNEKIAQMDTMRQQRIEYMKQFASEHPNSMVTALVVNNNLVYHSEPEELDTYADGFDQTNSKSPWVQSIREKTAVAKRLSIGQPFVDIKLPAPDGNEITLSDYAGKDKYVLINFWASWCKPCRIANSHLVELYKKYQDKGFEMVGISLDRNKAEWVKAIEADGLTWPQMSDLKFWQSEGAKRYLINTIPYTVLLDKDGKILAKGLQHDELEKKLAELTEETK
jgi:peroxiredoxin